MPNGSLYDQLHGHGGCRSQLSSSSPVTVSWKTRVQVLLGAARAIKHLHCHAVALINHGNVASSNVLLDVRHLGAAPVRLRLVGVPGRGRRAWTPRPWR